MTDTLVIAIDGPSGSGKSSVSKAVARHFNLEYLDTGAMYRALTWYCLDEKVDVEDAAVLVTAARTFPYVQGTSPDEEVIEVGEWTYEKRSARPVFLKLSHRLLPTWKYARF